MEYTYFFSRNDFWHDTDFYTTFDVGKMPYNVTEMGNMSGEVIFYFLLSWDTEEKRKAGKQQP